MSTMQANLDYAALVGAAAGREGASPAVLADILLRAGIEPKSLHWARAEQAARDAAQKVAQQAKSKELFREAGR